MKQKLAKLIDLKSIITLGLVATLIYGFVVGKIPTEQFIPLVTLVMSFYFAKTNKKDGE